MTPRSTPRRDAPVGDLPGLLVEPSWLRDRIGSEDLRIVDLREADAYANGHIPTATNLQVAELGKRANGLDNVLLAPDEFNRVVARQGISNGDTVVAYDDQWGLAAARLVWALRYYGHVDAAVLDGGWDRWEDEGGPTEDGVAQIAPGSFRAALGPDARADLYADIDWIDEHIREGSAVLVDTRTGAEFDRGHLPGAISWDWLNAVPVGEWSVSRDPEELRAEWKALGLDSADEIAVYCRSGMRAAHTWLVMRAAGLDRVRLYDGSWQEWSLKNPEEADG